MSDKDALHPSDRSWIAYHVKMGMEPMEAVKVLAYYRELVRQVLGKAPDADISHVVAAAEQRIGELMLAEGH